MDLLAVDDDRHSGGSLTLTVALWRPRAAKANINLSRHHPLSVKCRFNSSLTSGCERGQSIAPTPSEAAVRQIGISKADPPRRSPDRPPDFEARARQITRRSGGRTHPRRHRRRFAEGYRLRASSGRLAHVLSVVGGHQPDGRDVLACCPCSRARPGFSSIRCL